MRFSILLILLSMLFASCSSSRWIVTEQFALDQTASAEVLDQKEVILVEKKPTPDNPVITFTAFEITEYEYPLRVKVERTVQQYRPRWGYLLLGVAGASFAVLAANSDALLPALSGSQKLTLNVTGGVLGALSLFNMQPTGDPIYTGETQMMRRSGIEILKDSTRSVIQEENTLSELIVTYNEDVLFSQTDLSFLNSSIDLNLSSFSSELSNRVNEDSEISVSIIYQGDEYEFPVPIKDFLAPFLNITEPVILLRSSPEVTPANIISEVGRGSFLKILNDENDDWYRVQHQNTQAYVRKETGDIEWMTTSESGPALVFEFAELPFGEIDVENTVPILKQPNPNDKAIIITNGIENRLGIRQYLERDHRLFSHYMTTALQMNTGNVHTIKERGNGEMLSVREMVSPMNNSGSLVVYLSGYASIEEVDGRGEIVLNYLDEDDENHQILLSDIFTEIKNLEPESLFLFVDLQYTNGTSSNGAVRNGNTSILSRVSNQILRELPNTAIVFSNRPGQQSNLYTGLIEGNNRHSIFSYYLADALKKRNTGMSSLVRYLDRNVDYTSRRLHDRPQEINAFGNLTLNIAQ